MATPETQHVHESHIPDRQLDFETSVKCSLPPMLLSPALCTKLSNVIVTDKVQKQVETRCKNVALVRCGYICKHLGLSLDTSRLTSCHQVMLAVERDSRLPVDLVQAQQLWNLEVNPAQHIPRLVLGASLQALA